jgi:hypothetical protein
MRSLAAILLLAPSLALPADVNVDVTADRHPISPDVYGINFGTKAQLTRMGVTVRRSGGNSMTRYNWKASTTNTAQDWYWENIVDTVPAGFASTLDAFVDESKKAGVPPLLTLQAMGWIAKPGSKASHPFDCSFDAASFPSQQAFDPWDANCGNGKSSSGADLTPGAATKTSIAADETWTTEFVQHLVATFGAAKNGGVRLYSIDNEPAIWGGTHRDVHPTPTKYLEVRDALAKHGAAVKAVDPDALVIGPAEYGWTGWFYLSYIGEQNTYGDFVAWYLDQAKAMEQTGGKRILDYFDLHNYPQGTNVYSDDVSAATSALRLRSTRQLWDPNYLDESWIGTCCNEKVNLVNRMKGWVAAHYPGTKISISEYSWGALDYVSGALAEADVLGILGREAVDMATLWGPPSDGAIGEDAFKLYRNYDGAGAQYGDTSVRATVADPDKLTAYAATTAKGSLTVAIVNKQPSTDEVVKLNLTGLSGATAWRAFSFGNGGRLAPAGGGTVNGGSISLTVAAYTAAMVEVSTGGSDGGIPPGPDAGSGPDAGGGVDAGSSPDAGSVVDAGGGGPDGSVGAPDGSTSAGDGGGNPGADGGAGKVGSSGSCGCGATSGIGVLPVLFATRRRRRG